MNRVNWVAMAVFVAVVLLVVTVGLGALLLLGGIMGAGLGRGGMMGGWCPWCGGTGGLAIGGAARLLILLVVALAGMGLLSLLVVGLVWWASRRERAPEPGAGEESGSEDPLP